MLLVEYMKIHYLTIKILLPY